MKKKISQKFITRTNLFVFTVFEVTALVLSKLHLKKFKMWFMSHTLVPTLIISSWLYLVSKYSFITVFKAALVKILAKF